jgi:hypothetical protein
MFTRRSSRDKRDPGINATGGVVAESAADTDRGVIKISERQRSSRLGRKFAN